MFTNEDLELALVRGGEAGWDGSFQQTVLGWGTESLCVRSFSLEPFCCVTLGDFLPSLGFRLIIGSLRPLDT